MGGCQGSERETQLCSRDCRVPSFAGKQKDQGMLRCMGRQAEGRAFMLAKHFDIRKLKNEGVQ